ncbi:MAG TPA: DUF6789 family protein [Thermoanaerobaculia bacterium]|nr:DUF6789 family protein [Thermoanaerobaculia bacterium]
MSAKKIEELLLSLFALALAGVSFNLFPAAQAGIAKMSYLGSHILVPSVVLLIVVLILAIARHHRRLSNRILAGAAAGLIATFGLEVIRATSFHLGGMPGDMPQLLGVLLTDRFMLGPSALSTTLGYLYHFWNGISFGIVFAVLFGRKPILWALVYAQLIGIGFLLSPAVKAMGIGFMGSQMPAMPLTVVLAHLAYGVILGLLAKRWTKTSGWLFARGGGTDA